MFVVVQMRTAAGRIQALLLDSVDVCRQVHGHASTVIERSKQNMLSKHFTGYYLKKQARKRAAKRVDYSIIAKAH